MSRTYAEYELEKTGETLNIAMIEEIRDNSISEGLNQELKWKPPEHMKSLTCRWVLREKQNSRLKVRLLARRFKQEEAVDY